MNEIEQELQDKLDIKPIPKKSRQNYLDRLAVGASKAPDDVWEGLSKGAQDWVNAAIKARNAKDPIPDFDGGPETDAEDEAPSNEKKSTKGSGKSDKASSAKKDKDSKSKVSGGAGVRTAGTLDPKGIKYRIKMAVIKDPDISVEDLTKKLENDGGEKPSKMTVSAIRAEFRHSLKVLKAAGRLDITI